LEIRKTLLEPFKNENKTIFFSPNHPSLIRLFKYIYNESKYFSTILSSNLRNNFKDKLFKELISHGENKLNYSFQNDIGINMSLFSHYGMSGLVGLILHWIDEGYK